MAKRMVASLAANYAVEGGGRERAKRGQEITLSAEEEKRLDDLGALVPKGSTLDEHLASLEDHYRAGRGDVEAYNRALEGRKGGIVDLSEDVPQGNDAEAIAEYLRTQKPTVEETVGLAEGNADRAAVVLEAENLATGQEPRAGVEKGLQRVIDEGGEE